MFIRDGGAPPPSQQEEQFSQPPPQDRAFLMISSRSARVVSLIKTDFISAS